MFFLMAAKLTIDVLSLFPDMVEAPLGGSILGKARDRGLLEIRCHNIRDWTTDKHRKNGRLPLRRGAGHAAEAGTYLCRRRGTSPAGNPRCADDSSGPYVQPVIGRGIGCLRRPSHIFCGHYEGVDHRVVEELVDMELSIGDYILTNGAIASVVVIDAVARLIPGVLGDERSSVEESFSNGLLEAPAYTKPNVFRGLAVPEILLGGNHPAIEKWKHGKSLERTRLTVRICGGSGWNRIRGMPQSDIFGYCAKFLLPSSEPSVIKSRLPLQGWCKVFF